MIKNIKIDFVILYTMMISFIKNNKFNILLVAIWLFITIFAMFSHEIWRDEAQCWCLARDLNFVELFSAARVEGHPMLWYLLLFPLAKIGFPVISMQVLSLFLVFLAVVFFVFKSPFDNIFKFLFVLSAGMAYY
ncbi:MAG: hypothetical protein LUG16_00425, partial [Candidatus Gastranaerophilales bacterium]|nr:hypothetical protein [Candidatus Gastranaerophilales bacterium]